MNLSFFKGKELWIIIFVIGTQLHFYGLIFPEIKDTFIPSVGTILVIIGAALILVLFNVSGKNKPSFVGVKSS